MYVRAVQIRRFRHLEDVALGPFRQPPSQSELVALAGPNGGGKSSILELLGHALSNSWSLSYPISRTFPEASSEIELGLSTVECDLARGWAAETQSTLDPEVLTVSMKAPTSTGRSTSPAVSTTRIRRCTTTSSIS
jgi:energy-coupling factor transporter ATP-binding protein EcfA2